LNILRRETLFVTIYRCFQRKEEKERREERQSRAAGAHTYLKATAKAKKKKEWGKRRREVRIRARRRRAAHMISPTSPDYINAAHARLLATPNLNEFSTSE
jgi:hypothetical protein